MRCLVAGIDSPLTRGIAAALKDMGFEVTEVSRYMKAHRLMCMGTFDAAQAFDALVVIDSERTKEITPSDMHGNPTVPKKEVIDSGRELVSLVRDRHVGGTYPRTVVVKTDVNIGPLTAAFVLNAEGKDFEEFDARLFKEQFKDMLPSHERAA